MHESQRTILQLQMIQTCIVLDRRPGVVVRNENASYGGVARLDCKVQRCVAILMPIKKIVQMKRGSEGISHTSFWALTSAPASMSRVAAAQ